jgi:hypothetical protein
MPSWRTAPVFVDERNGKEEDKAREYWACVCVCTVRAEWGRDGGLLLAVARSAR